MVLFPRVWGVKQLERTESALGVVLFPRMWGVKQLERTESALGVVLFPRVWGVKQLERTKSALEVWSYFQECEGLSNLSTQNVLVNACKHVQDVFLWP